MRLLMLKVLSTIVLIPVLLILLLLIMSNSKESEDLEKLPTLTAKVDAASVVSKRRRKGVAHCPKVIVAYDYGGKHYAEALNIGEALCSPFAATAEKTVSGYKPGNSVDIKVIPDKPNKPYLSTYELGFWHYLLIAIELMLGVGLILLWRVKTLAKPELA